MPSKSSAAKALLDIRDCIATAQEFSRGLTFEQFCGNKIVYHATTRMLEIISEASKRLAPEVKARHPAIPWQNIRDAGNFYRHEYDNIADRSIWDTLKKDLPPLSKAIEDEIARLEQQP